jgi:hypothetical protein
VPEAISSAIGVSPDRTWKVGDKRPHTIIEEKCNGWILGSGLDRSVSLEKQIETLLGKIENCNDAIRTLSRSDTVELSCVIYADATPALNFDASIIDKIAQLGASLDIDLYINKQPD